MHSSSIGEIPQDLKFGGERTKTFIGKRTRIREYVTINRGTKELGETRVGSDCLLMASTHVAHDCIVGDNVEIKSGCFIECAILEENVVINQNSVIGKSGFGFIPLKNETKKFFHVGGVIISKNSNIFKV